MKNTVKNLVLSLSIILTLSSCGMAKNVAGEANDYKKAVSNEATFSEGVVAKEEASKESAEKTEEKTSEAETSNTDYLAEEDKKVESTDEMPVLEEAPAAELAVAEDVIANESTVDLEDVALEEAKEETSADESSAFEQILALTANESTLENLEVEETTPAVANDVPAPVLAENNQPATITQVENSEALVATTVSELTIKTGDKVKTYQETQAGLEEAKTDFVNELKDLIYLSKSEKIAYKEKLKEENTVAATLNLLANMRNFNEDKKAFLMENADINEAYDFVAVTEVIAADTLKVALDGKEVYVKLKGVDTPDKNTANGDEYFSDKALAYTTELLDSKYIWLEKDGREVDANGNLTSYGYLALPGSAEELFDCNISGLLIKEGMGNTEEINDKYTTAFKVVEEKAIAKNVGMWK